MFGKRKKKRHMSKAEKATLREAEDQLKVLGDVIEEQVNEIYDLDMGLDVVLEYAGKMYTNMITMKQTDFVEYVKYKEERSALDEGYQGMKINQLTKKQDEK